MRLSVSVRMVAVCIAGAHCAGEEVAQQSTTGSEILTTSSSASSSSGTSEAPTSEAGWTESTTGNDMPSTEGPEPTTGEPEQFSYEGEHVVVIADEGLELCGGTMQHMDSFISQASMRFGVQAPVGDDRIRFTWVKDSETLHEHCSIPDVLGCAQGGGRSASTVVPLNHELIHNITYRIKGRHPRPFFTEGAAVAFGGYDGRLFREYAKHDIEILDLLELSRSELGGFSGAYPVVGQFAGYLIGRHGIDDFIRLYSEVAADATIEQIDQNFHDVLGVSLTESVAEFQDLTNPWSYCNFDALLSECNAPAIPWNGEYFEVESEIDCSRADTIGPYDGRMSVEFTFDIYETSFYELRLAGDEQIATFVPDMHVKFEQANTAVSIFPCGSCSTGFMETQKGGTPRWTTLRPGRHSLRLLAPVNEPGTIAFGFKRLPEAPGDVIKEP